MGSVIVHAPLFSLNLPSFLPSLHIGFYYVDPCQHDTRMRSQGGPSSQSSFLLANRITCPDFIKLIKTQIVERQRETKVKLRAQIWKLWVTLQGLFQFHSSLIAVHIILVLVERSLSPTKVLWRQICPSPFKLMTSQSVLQGSWIGTSCYGWFRGEWVTVHICYIRTFLLQVWLNRLLYFGILIGN